MKRSIVLEVYWNGRKIILNNKLSLLGTLQSLLEILRSRRYIHLIFLHFISREIKLRILIFVNGERQNKL